MKRIFQMALFILATFNLQISTARAQGTAFTYQGRLNASGSPANGSYDIQFTLFTTNTGGSVYAGPVTNTAVAVTNGLFTTTVDFGARVFTGMSNWLALAVSTNGANAFSTLTPRQQITPTPYALYAATAAMVAPGAVTMLGTPGNGPTNTVNVSANGTVTVTTANLFSVSASDVTLGLNNTASGYASTAIGYSTTASGDYSTAMGYESKASGLYSTAMGNNSTASGDFSTAMGVGAHASHDYDMAMGYNTTASGGNSTAIGDNSTASGFDSTAMGCNTTASGSASTAMGYYTIASGTASFAAGASATTIFNGTNCNNAFVWGDGSRTSIAQGADTFNVLATGGVWFFTGPYPDGVKLAPNGTAWATISDQNAKKNFTAVNGEEILNQLAAVPVEKWNYKWEKDTDVPNIGPMAQAFKHAFYPGRDDKSITTLEFDGVELAAIQGLNQKLAEKDTEIQALKQSVDELKKMVQSLAAKK